MDLPVLGIQTLVQNSPAAAAARARGQGGQGSLFGAPIIPSSEEVITRQKLVDGEFKTMNADVQANVAPLAQGTTDRAPSAQAFLDNWRSFKASWDDFFGKHQTVTSIVWPAGPGTGTVDREVTAFENQLAGYRSALVQQFPGAKLSTPPIASTENANITPSPSTLPAPKIQLPTWAIISMTLAGVGLVGYLGYRLYEAVSPTARLAAAIHGMGGGGGGGSGLRAQGSSQRGSNDLYEHHLRHGAGYAHDPGPGPVRYAGDYGPGYRGVAVE